MRPKLKATGFFVLVPLAALVLSGPLAAAAADRGEKLDFRLPPGFDNPFKNAYGQAPAAGSPEKKSSLIFKLYGGFSHMAAGDVNDGCDGYFEAFELYASMVGGEVTGGYSPVHIGPTFGLDVIFQLSRNIGVGLGAGYLRASKSSLLTLTFDGEELELTGRPELNAIPVRLGVFLTLPLSKTLNLTADAGAAYYAGLKFKAVQRITWTDGTWDEMAVEGSRSSDLGFHGSLGVEYKLSPKLGLFIETVGRYARLKNFDTVTTAERDSGGDTYTDTGKIYLVTKEFVPGSSISMFEISDTPPPPGVEYREPKFDFSGFSLQAGIRIRI